MAANMNRFLAYVLLALTITGCARAIPTQAVPTAIPTPTHSSTNCFFNWATRPLPSLSEQFQAAIDLAGLKGVTATAEAFGEDCIDYQTLQVVGFSAMETDFRLSVPVKTLGDKNELGTLLEKILKAITGLPPGSFSGPQPGYVGVTFRSGDDESRLWFTLTDGNAAMERGLRGAALLEALQK